MPGCVRSSGIGVGRGGDMMAGFEIFSGDVYGEGGVGDGEGDGTGSSSPGTGREMSHPFSRIMSSSSPVVMTQSTSRVEYTSS